MSGTSFPSLLEVLGYLGWQVLFGPAALLLSAFFWLVLARQVFRTVRDRLRGREAEVLAVFVVPAGITLVIGVCGTYSVYATLSNALWWQFAPEDVAEVEVVRAPVSGRPGAGPPVYLRDQDVLRDGFRRLAGAPPYRRYGEVYRDGYLLRIRKVGEAEFSDRYLAVYRHSSRQGRLPVVVAQRGPVGDSSDQLAGEFLSPSFLQWVAEVIDPLFAGRPKP